MHKKLIKLQNAYGKREGRNLWLALKAGKVTEKDK